MNLLSNARVAHPFPIDPLLRFLEPSKEMIDIHDDDEEVFNKESNLPGGAWRSQLLLHQQKDNDNLAQVYMTTTLSMEETPSFWKEYNLDKDIPDGLE